MCVNAHALNIWDEAGSRNKQRNQIVNVFILFVAARALPAGKVKIAGVEASFHSAPIVTQIFEGMIADRKFDVSELGMTYFLRTFENGESPFVAIPVFPDRAFRHSAIYINKASGITRPEDLNGKTIGELALYSHDAGLMPKGILSDEYGFKPETCRSVIGGLDWPLKPIDLFRIPIRPPSRSPISKGQVTGCHA